MFFFFCLYFWGLILGPSLWGPTGGVKKGLLFCVRVAEQGRLVTALHCA